MTAHIVLLILILINGVRCYSKESYFPYCSQKRNARFVISSELMILCLVGLRASSVGIDTVRYERFFDRISQNADYMERLDWAVIFRTLVMICEKFNSFQMLLIICALINCIGFGWFALSVTEDNEAAFWYILFFVTFGSYFNSMNVIRQVCAMSVTINIYGVLHKNRNLKSFGIALLLLLVGLGFHSSAILSIGYFLPFIIKEIDKKAIMIISFISLLLIVAYSTVIPLVFSFWDVYERYSEDARLSSGHTGVFAISMILLRIIMIGVVLRMDAKKPENQDIYRQTVYTVISTALFILQAQTQFALRTGYYFEIFFLLYVPTFVRKFKSKRSRWILYSLLSLYAIAYFIYALMWGGSGSNRATVPYYFFWQ